MHADLKYSNRIYRVGEDELYGVHEYFEDFGALWVVYDYEQYSYEGRGSLVYWTGEKLIEIGLGHCSCFGPLDDWEDGVPVQLSDLLNDDIHATELPGSVIKKVKELLFPEVDD